VRAKKIFAARWIFGRLGGVDGNPADALGIEFRPTVIAGDLARPPVSRHRKSNDETRRNAERPGIADKNRVEIGAVSAAVFAGIIDVAAAPALAAFVVLHGRDYVVVNGARHFQIAFRVRRVHHFTGPCADLFVERYQTVRFEPALDIAGVQFD
jgi:hypothetical protein